VPAVRTQIEDGVIALLAPLVGPVVRGARPWQGEITEDMKDPWRAFQTQGPAILVKTTDATFEPVQLMRKRVRGTYTVEVTVVSPSQRSPEEAARDDVVGGGAGAYLIMEEIQALLVGARPVPGSSPMEPTGEQHQPLKRTDLQVWRLDYEVMVTVDATKPESGPLTEVHTRHFLPIEETTFATGIGDSLVFATPITCLVDAGAAFTAAQVGSYIEIVGATTPANNGTFEVTAVLGPTSLEFANPVGVTELYSGAWTLRAAPVVKTIVVAT
jgi:hypothetical protein